MDWWIDGFKARKVVFGNGFGGEAELFTQVVLDGLSFGEGASEIGSATAESSNGVYKRGEELRFRVEERDGAFEVEAPHDFGEGIRSKGERAVLQVRNLVRALAAFQGPGESKIFLAALLLF